MPPPPGSILDIKAVVKLSQRIQRGRDPAVARKLLALADMLAEAEDKQLTIDSDGTL